ncbi:metallo-beta-lactamase L1 [Janthinobacterium sp. HH01]|uniref:subclass B3 metallo-beta-lactamase n=1 Tax=Janthinobacterium sp. HH01 TaxID=1198452 RepID=UPI0002AEA65E|nr:subclass B3 metallo-beta-lactamase [Janthinobacterium sp. HH01]ELX09746.1 metallo-beta-lactamase L1 [Janthinobacterium sp. HH01]
MIKSLVAAVLCGLSTLAGAHVFDDWNKPVEPFQIYGGSYYVGVAGLSSVLVTSPQGHILIDGAFPDSPELIAASIRKLGFKLRDVKLILSSHDHWDHAGGIAALQRMTGAQVVASPATAAALRRGSMGEDDPQFQGNTPYPKVASVRTVRDGEVVKLGPLAMTALYTPGHTTGGTSWTWNACEQGRCASIVFADSINPVSSDGYKFSAHPAVLKQYEQSYAALEKAACDIVVSGHPDFTGMWDKVKSGKPHALLDGGEGCKAYVQQSREKLNKRLAEEAGK